MTSPDAPRPSWPFLTARWTNVFLATYAVPPDLLIPRLPPGLELDTRDGQVFASLVCFDFQDTRVLGVPWPGFILYNEPYLATEMTSSVVEEPEAIQVEHRLTFAGRTHTMRAVGAKPAIVPGPESVEAFFKEHHWGYGKTRRGRTLRYHVWHPVWSVYPVRAAEVDLDWGAVYGPEWAVMQKATPVSTVLAVGSAIAVYPKGKLAILSL